MSEEARQLARCVVVIPALDPDGALPGYAAALLERGAEGVVAVDDGSRPSCRAVFEELEKLENTAAFLMSDLNGFSKRLCACLSVGGPWGYQADGGALTRLLEEAGRASGTLPPGARPRQEARSKRDLLRLAVYTGAWERAAEQLGGGLLWRLPPRQALDREKFARLYPSCGAFLE